MIFPHLEAKRRQEGCKGIPLMLWNPASSLCNGMDYTFCISYKCTPAARVCACVLLNEWMQHTHSWAFSPHTCLFDSTPSCDSILSLSHLLLAAFIQPFNLFFSLLLLSSRPGSLTTIKWVSIQTLSILEKNIKISINLCSFLLFCLFSSDPALHCEPSVSLSLPYNPTYLHQWIGGIYCSTLIWLHWKQQYESSEKKGSKVCLDGIEWSLFRALMAQPYAACHSWWHTHLR